MAERRFQPFEMLDPGRVLVGSRQMQMDFHDEVRRHDHAALFGGPGDLEKRRDAAHARRVVHNHIDRAGIDVAQGFGGTGQHFAGADGRIQLRGQRGVSGNVVRIERLLDPFQLVLLQHAPHA